MNKAIAEVRGMDSRELRNKLQDLRKEQFGLRFHGADEQVARPTRFQEIRRSIARILTVLGERDRTGNDAPVPVPPPPAGVGEKGEKKTRKAKAVKPPKAKAEKPAKKAAKAEATAEKAEAKSKGKTAKSKAKKS